MEKDRIGIEKAEPQLVQCKLILYQLSNSNSTMTEEGRETRYQLLDFHLDNIEKLLGLSTKEKVREVVRKFELKIDEDGK